MAQGLVGSEILRIAAEIRALQAAGREVCDLTVGDFSPRQFPIPDRLARRHPRRAGARARPTTRPAPACSTLRQAVRRFYARELGLDYPLESVLIAGGARPVIYCLYRTVCDPGDRVVYPVPSWNNNHYAHLVGAQAGWSSAGPSASSCRAGRSIVPLLPGARLLCLNSPLNPAGTAIDRGDAARRSARRSWRRTTRAPRRGERPLYLMYDHIYWMLTFAGTRARDPARRSCRRWRATRSSWTASARRSRPRACAWAGRVGPADVIARMSAILGHVGAWAPAARAGGHGRPARRSGGDPRLPPDLQERAWLRG